jgi:hypothetical protein
LGFPTDFSKWLSFQYVVSFVLQKCPFQTLYFQYVPSFVHFAILAPSKNIKSACNLGALRLTSQLYKSLLARAGQAHLPARWMAEPPPHPQAYILANRYDFVKRK